MLCRKQGFSKPFSSADEEKKFFFETSYIAPLPFFPLPVFLDGTSWSNGGWEEEYECLCRRMSVWEENYGEGTSLQNSSSCTLWISSEGTENWENVGKPPMILAQKHWFIFWLPPLPNNPLHFPLSKKESLGSNLEQWWWGEQRWFQINVEQGISNWNADFHCGQSFPLTSTESTWLLDSDAQWREKKYFKYF